MTRDDIIRMAREAGFEDGYGNHLFPPGDYREEVIPVTKELERFAALVAAEKEQQMIRDGWRKCAKGQRTTQYCGLLEEAVEAEREACAKVCEGLRPSKPEYDQRFNDGCTLSAAAIRARDEERPYAAQAATVASQTHGRMQIDPATGDVSIGAIRARGET